MHIVGNVCTMSNINTEIFVILLFAPKTSMDSLWENTRLWICEILLLLLWKLNKIQNGNLDSLINEKSNEKCIKMEHISHPSTALTFTGIVWNVFQIVKFMHWNAVDRAGFQVDWSVYSLSCLTYHLSTVCSSALKDVWALLSNVSIRWIGAGPISVTAKSRLNLYMVGMCVLRNPQYTHSCD